MYGVTGEENMAIDETTEKRFEADIESYFLSPEGGYTRNNDFYDPRWAFTPIH